MTVGARHCPQAMAERFGGNPLLFSCWACLTNAYEPDDEQLRKNALRFKDACAPYIIMVK